MVLKHINLGLRAQVVHWLVARSVLGVLLVARCPGMVPSNHREGALRSVVLIRRGDPRVKVHSPVQVLLLLVKRMH